MVTKPLPRIKKPTHPALAAEFQTPHARAACRPSLTNGWLMPCWPLHQHQGRNRGQPQSQPVGPDRSFHRGTCPELLGGSADLTGSNLTNTPSTSTPNLRVNLAGEVVKALMHGQIGRHINYGVREFGMAAIMNGVALHGGFIPYGGTFLTFSDYSRNAIRMAALMKQRVVHVFTHDSIGLGEDGPYPSIGRACGQLAL